MDYGPWTSSLNIMKIVRFSYRKKDGWGVYDEAQGNVRVLEKDPFSSFKTTSFRIPFTQLRLLPPALPSKIVLVGLNYRKHAREMNMESPKEPILFLKPPSSLIPDQASILYPQGVKRLDYEGELALVIKKKIKKIRIKDALPSVLGYTCLNDVTARDLQKQDGQWTRAKSFDTFCPVGPWLARGIDARSLGLTTYLNGKVVQKSCTDDFIFPLEKLIWFISRVMTLLPGDIISTGTPGGIGPMRPLDKVSVEIEKIGILNNTVKRA